MRYRYLLCDNDNTLMDFDAAERHALDLALAAFGLPTGDEVFHTYHAINKAQWEALERGETTQARLRVDRFALLLNALGCSGVDAECLSLAYGEHLATRADLLPGAMELVSAVHGHMKIALVTNGISATQRGRLARCPFTPLLDAIIISGEIGLSKPNPAFVRYALNALGCTDPRQAVLLGDSASADIAAARAAGVDSIHLAMRCAPSPDATYVATTLKEVCTLLMEVE